MKTKSKTPRMPPCVDKLYKAVQEYVKHGGGKLIVIGGVSVQEWPTDGKYVFHIAVKCLGHKPKF